MGLLLETLKSVDFLATLEEEAVVRFMVLGRSSDQKKGHVFWRSGATSTGIVIPVTGEAKLATRGADGREFIDSFRGPGEVMGLPSVLDGLPHVADAVVVRAGEFFTLRPERFAQFRREHPPVVQAAVELLGRRLRRQIQEREDIALRPVAERLAQFLVENACVRQDDGAKVLVDATQSEIAARLGTVREVVARVLGDFAKRGLIERSKQGTFVADWGGLCAAAGIEGDLPAATDDPSRYGPSPSLRTARFFLPIAERRNTRGEMNPEGCQQHLGDLDECRAKGCPGAARID